MGAGQPSPGCTENPTTRYPALPAKVLDDGWGAVPPNPTTGATEHLIYHHHATLDCRHSLAGKLGHRAGCLHAHHAALHLTHST